MFVSLHAPPAGGEPEALVYGDATATLCGRNTTSLDEALTQSCRFGVPTPDSVAALLSTLYTRLHAHFLGRSSLVPPSGYLRAPRPDLGALLGRYDEGRPVGPHPDHRHDEDRRRYRRETLALLAAHHEHYADAPDVLRGLREADAGPGVLRGVAHGDLHARNVQVALDGDRVSQCAVFDYEGFGGDNFIAWDFVKLEVEAAVRLLDRFGDPAAPAFARQ